MTLIVKPLFKGTLEEKLKEAKKTNSLIKSIKRKGVRESIILDKLLEQKYELEWDIKRHLYTEEISNPILDYSFVNFIQGKAVNEKEYPESIFEKSKLVEEFIKDVKEMNGERILSVQGSYLSLGVISGDCIFKVSEKKFRDFYVSVKTLNTFNNQKLKWKISASGLLYVNSDIFKFPKDFLGFNLKETRKLENQITNCFKKIGKFKKLKGYNWSSDYSQTNFFGKRPENIIIYIGNDFVKRAFKDGIKYEVPSRSVKVPSPF